MPTEFVHLHVHSEYSLLDGLGKVDALAKRAHALGQKALALTDHGALYGALHFYNACKKNEVKPIVGCEVYVAKNSRLDKQTKMGADQAHLTLIALNFEGYQNLNRLVSIANFEGFSYKPRIDEEVLAKHSKGLLCLTGCMNSPINQLLRSGDIDGASTKLGWYHDIFKEHLFVEIQNHPQLGELEELTQKQIALARRHALPLVATNDVHYVNPDDAIAQDALLCVQTRKLMSDTHRMSMMDSPDYYLKSSEEMAEAFSSYPEAITNTLEVASRCDLTIPTGQLIFPKYPVPDGMDYAEFLKQMAFEGAKKKIGAITPEIEERLNYELGIINDKGYAAYFLITQDFVNWAKAQGIAVGPGRGSAAGSLVSYCVNITTLNPLQHGLAFERFLNPQRPTPPDVDLDFADDRRDEVIRYVSQKYGEDHVAHVITFGRMEARVAVRDIGRVLGLPYEDPDKIAKLIPNNPAKKTSLQQAIETVPELAEYYKQPKFKQLIDLAQKVEGGVRHTSVHAAAVIVTDQPLPNYVAIQKDSKTGKTITQFDMYALDCNVSDDAIGLLKFDFLGLRNLSIIQTALQLISRYHGTDIDISNLPLDDKKTFELLSRGETTGVFQLESAGMRRVARTLRPNQFSDITAMVALYRPGPMDLIPTFIEGKHSPEKIEYPHPSLKPVLEETYGVMVYQEQVMAIANVMAGYSLGEADILRRAIGKKKKKLLDENKKRFIDQSVEKGYEKAIAEKVWGFIEAFANYGFNKAHAACYAMIAYQTAYLKANYPVEYMTALMSVESASHNMNRDTKVAVAIEACKELKIPILPPDINKSSDDFVIESDQSDPKKRSVRFGFTAIKHVGSAAIQNILEVRKKLGQFTSFTQFIHETDGRKVNKTTLECLIKVGAMDQFGTRASMLENLESIRQTASQLQSQDEGQDSLFAGVGHAQEMKDTFAKLPEYPKQELLSFEKELLGLYLTDHPMAHQLKAVQQRATKLVGELDSSIHQGQTFVFGGVLTKLRNVNTKSTGALMAFGELEDTSGSVPIVFFPRVYQQYQAFLKSDEVALIKAKVDLKEEEVQLIAEKVSDPKEFLSTSEVSGNHQEIFIPRNTSKEKLQELGKLLKSHPGDESVVILIPTGSTPQRMLLPYTVAWSEALAKQVNELISAPVTQAGS